MPVLTIARCNVEVVDPITGETEVHWPDGPCASDGNPVWIIHSRRIDTHEHFNDYLMLTIAKLMMEMLCAINSDDGKVMRDEHIGDYDKRLSILMYQCGKCGIHLAHHETAKAISAECDLSTGQRGISQRWTSNEEFIVRSWFWQRWPG